MERQQVSLSSAPASSPILPCSSDLTAKGQWRGWPTQLSRRRQIATPRCTLLEISSLDTPRWLGHNWTEKKHSKEVQYTKHSSHITGKGKNLRGKATQHVRKVLNWSIYKPNLVGCDFRKFCHFCNFV